MVSVLLLNELVLQEPNWHLLLLGLGLRLLLLLLDLTRLLVHLLLLVELLLLAVGLDLIVALRGYLTAHELLVLLHVLEQRIVVHLLE